MRTPDEFAALVKQAAWEAFDALCREDGKSRDAAEIARERPLIEVAAKLLIDNAPPNAHAADDATILAAVRRIIRAELATARPS
jgi:hypothetical protein